MHSVPYQLSPRVGVEMGPHKSQCSISKGFVVLWTGTLMRLFLWLAWMQTAHIESSCVNPSIRDFMVVRFIWVSCRCQSLDSEIVRDFRVDLVLTAMDAVADTIVGSIVGSIVGATIICSIVVSAIIGSIVGSVISAL